MLPRLRTGSRWPSGRSGASEGGDCRASQVGRLSVTMFGDGAFPRESRPMTTTFANNPLANDALETCIRALSRIADYQLEPSFQRRLDDLGERKEFLSPAEHDELLAL